MKTIKTREVVKDIKTLDRSESLASRSKNSFVKTKERAEETQSSRNASPGEYATTSVQDKSVGAVQAVANLSPSSSSKNTAAKNVAEKVHKTSNTAKGNAEAAKKTANNVKKTADNAKKTADNAKKTAAKTKAAVKDAKANYQKARRSGRQAVHSAKHKFKTEKSSLYRKNPVNHVGRNPTKNIRHATKGLKDTAKNSVKTANKSIKMARRSVKTAKTAAIAARRSAIAARRAAVMARFAAVKGVWLAKMTVIGILKLIKLAILAVKKLVVIIAAGGWIAVAVILIIVLIGAVLSSVFGIFFSDGDDPDSGWTVRQAIAQIDMEFNAEIDSIILSNAHDILDVSGMRAAWRDVLAVYAVSTATSPDNPMEVATMNDEKYELLRNIFWDMNSISHYIGTHEEEYDVIDENGDPTGETETVTIYTLYIVMESVDIGDIAAEYGFNDEQMDWLEELLLPEYMSLWNALLFGVASGTGSSAMVEVALSQLGNEGGELYWRWYGFDSRMPWCAIFVSWVAEQCGLIQSGTIPKFASTSVGVQWFQSRGLWQPQGYTPAPGDLIFFDRTGSGSPDHVGIVERVDGGVVHTVEGNSSDMVSRRSYQLNAVTILGYGVLI